MKKLLAILILTLLFGACSTAQQANLATLNSGSSSGDSQAFSNFLDTVSKITQQDITTALADVHSKGDMDLAALSCYPALSAFLSDPNIKLTMPTVDGAISLNQLKRDVMLGITSGTSPQQLALRKLHVACAAYISDERRFAAEFAIMVGAASHGVPPAAALPGAVGKIIAPAISAIKP